jgi:signal transduction histidine kinase
VSRGGEQSSERSALEFFGTLTASVTHELNNVLSIVDQARGLLGDLTALAGSGRGIDPRRLETIGERIDRQVRKGVEILNRVNRFSHSLDDPGAEFDADAEAENLVSLARRFADLKKVRLEFAPSADEVRSGGDAFALQQGIFICLRMILNDSEEGDRIACSVRRDGNDAVISISASAHCNLAGDDLRIRDLARLMGLLDGVHRVQTDEHGGTSFELRFPVAAGRITTEEKSDPGGQPRGG